MRKEELKLIKEKLKKVRKNGEGVLDLRGAVIGGGKEGSNEYRKKVKERNRKRDSLQKGVLREPKWAEKVRVTFDKG